MKKRRFMKAVECMVTAGCGKTKFNEMVRVGDFPSPITLPDGRTRLWDSDEVDAWYDGLVAAKKATCKCLALTDPLNALFGQSLPNEPKSGFGSVASNEAGKSKSRVADTQGAKQ